MTKLERLLNLIAALIHTVVPLTADEIRERVEGYGGTNEASFRRAFERDPRHTLEQIFAEGISLDALLVGLFQNGTARRWELASLNAVSGTGTLPSAAVSLLSRDGRKLDEAATGDGPVDAVFKCIERITGVKVRLRDFTIASVTAGEDAQGEVVVVVEHEGRTYRGRGLNTDIVMASAEAYLEVINRIAAGRLQRKTPPEPEVVCGAV